MLQSKNKQGKRVSPMFLIATQTLINPPPENYGLVNRACFVAVITAGYCTGAKAKRMRMVGHGMRMGTGCRGSTLLNKVAVRIHINRVTMVPIR